MANTFDKSSPRKQSITIKSCFSWRHYPECLYQNGTYASSYGLTSYLKENDIYASLYAVVSKANAVITSMENAENFESIINGGQSEMGQMYGEAVAMRATAYREL